jgi:hypothetical protein
MKTLSAMKEQFDSWYPNNETLVKTDPVAAFAAVKNILTGITLDDWFRLDDTVDRYPWGWVVRRWRNQEFDSRIFS